MYPVPRKYSTACVEKESGSLIFERIYEAINRDEAATRALLSCMGEAYRPGDLAVTAQRV